MGHAQTNTLWSEEISVMDANICRLKEIEGSETCTVHLFLSVGLHK